MSFAFIIQYIWKEYEKISIAYLKVKKKNHKNIFKKGDR